jgi:hypothetical protein
MIRRMQLLEPEPRFSAGYAALGARIREGLLRDNKVLPPVLAVLALLIFAWLAASVLTGEPGEEEERRTSNQAFLSQTPEENPDIGDPETRAPGVENRDADSFAAFKAKDPFRELIPKASEAKAESKAGESKSKAGESKSKTGESKSKANESKSKTGESKDRAGESRSKVGEGKADDDFIDQSFPGGPDPEAGGSGGAGQGGNGNLFNSGGDLGLPPPLP